MKQIKKKNFMKQEIPIKLMIFHSMFQGFHNLKEKKKIPTEVESGCLDSWIQLIYLLFCFFIKFYMHIYKSNSFACYRSRYFLRYNGVNYIGKLI